MVSAVLAGSDHSDPSRLSAVFRMSFCTVGRTGDEATIFIYITGCEQNLTWWSCAVLQLKIPIIQQPFSVVVLHFFFVSR